MGSGSAVEFVVDHGRHIFAHPLAVHQLIGTTSASDAQRAINAAVGIDIEDLDAHFPDGSTTTARVGSWNCVADLTSPLGQDADGDRVLAGSAYEAIPRFQEMAAEAGLEIVEVPIADVAVVRDSPPPKHHELAGGYPARHGRLFLLLGGDRRPYSHQDRHDT